MNRADRRAAAKVCRSEGHLTKAGYESWGCLRCGEGATEALS